MLDEDVEREEDSNPQAGTFQGDAFELKLVMLFLKRGMDKYKVNKEYSFRLSTQMPAGRKFNDIIFKSRNNNNEKYKLRFVQAKHQKVQSDPQKISEQSLLECKGDFSLLMYCNSYLEIKRDKAFEDAELEDFILATNRDLSLVRAASFLNPKVL
jgi:hypothetical protein